MSMTLCTPAVAGHLGRLVGMLPQGMLPQGHPLREALFSLQAQNNLRGTRQKLMLIVSGFSASGVVPRTPQRPRSRPVLQRKIPFKEVGNVMGVKNTYSLTNQRSAKGVHCHFRQVCCVELATCVLAVYKATVIAAATRDLASARHRHLIHTLGKRRLSREKVQCRMGGHRFRDLA